MGLHRFLQREPGFLQKCRVSEKCSNPGRGTAIDGGRGVTVCMRHCDCRGGGFDSPRPPFSDAGAGRPGSRLQPGTKSVRLRSASFSSCPSMLSHVESSSIVRGGCALHLTCRLGCPRSSRPPIVLHVSSPSRQGNGKRGHCNNVAPRDLQMAAPSPRKPNDTDPKEPSLVGNVCSRLVYGHETMTVEEPRVLSQKQRRNAPTGTDSGSLRTTHTKRKSRSR